MNRDLERTQKLDMDGLKNPSCGLEVSEKDREIG